MKTYGTLNDIDEGDSIANIRNATKSSAHRLDGKGAHRSSKKKRAIRTQMNKRTRCKLKNELKNQIMES